MIWLPNLSGTRIKAPGQKFKRGSDSTTQSLQPHHNPTLLRLGFSPDSSDNKKEHTIAPQTPESDLSPDWKPTTSKLPYHLETPPPTAEKEHNQIEAFQSLIDLKFLTTTNNILPESLRRNATRLFDKIVIDTLLPPQVSVKTVNSTSTHTSIKKLKAKKNAILVSMPAKGYLRYDSGRV